MHISSKSNQHNTVFYATAQYMNNGEAFSIGWEKALGNSNNLLTKEDIDILMPLATIIGSYSLDTQIKHIGEAVDSLIIQEKNASKRYYSDGKVYISSALALSLIIFTVLI